MADKAGQNKTDRGQSQAPKGGSVLPWRSLSFQLSFPVGLIIFLAIALGAYLNIQSQKQRLTQRVKDEGAGFAETLRRATFRTMMADQRGHLYSTIQDMADQPGISRVRIINAEGRIIFSSNLKEQGREVDKKAEACYGCHAQDHPLAKLPMKNRSRIFRASGGQRILGTILPIYNQPTCSGPPCHAHPKEQKVLGVLDVDMSLAGLDAQAKSGVLELIERLIQRGVGVVLVTHHAGDLPPSLTHVAELEGGRLVFKGARQDYSKSF